MSKHQLFFARLSGAEEVPPVRTNASGSTQFKVSRDERKIEFRLKLNNLRNLTVAHIHMGRRGENGPVVAFLFGPVDPGISVDKAIVEGIITAKDLVGPLKGRPLSALIELIREGNTYVNAHTSQFPNGEIRGQVKPFIHE